MAFFGLFDKKNCAICHGDIGLLGNRKLEDGNLCKHCAAKLSPWFSDRRHSTVAEIADQLAYREANRERAAAFRATRIYGEDKKLMIDDSTQTFAVTSSRDFVRDNPDIVDYAMVVNCRPEIEEHRWEVHHKGPDGRDVSFEPRRYRYEYDFYITIDVRHPFFDDMRFRLNNFNIKGENRAECMRFVTMTEDVVETMTGVRPDLSSQVPDRPLVCPVCRRPLPAIDAPCMFCAPMHQPMHAPQHHAPQPAPTHAPQPAPNHGPQSGPNPGPAPRPNQPHSDSISQRPGPNGSRPGQGPKPNGPRG